jgi:hypothetical protein
MSKGFFYGQIVRIRVARHGNDKLRPVVVVTPNEAIARGVTSNGCFKRHRFDGGNDCGPGSEIRLSRGCIDDRAEANVRQGLHWWFFSQAS